MDIVIRAAVPVDAESCGRIIYDAFKGVAERHGFPPHFPTEEIAIERAIFCISHPLIYGVVALRSAPGRKRTPNCWSVTFVLTLRRRYGVST